MEENRNYQTESDREKNRETVRQLFEFITASPSPFHAVQNMRQRAISSFWRAAAGNYRKAADIM